MAHRTVHSTCPVCTGLSGGTTGRSAQRGRRQALSGCSTGLSGVHRTVRCANGQTATVESNGRIQRSTATGANGRLTWHAPDSEQYYVRSTTRLSVVPIDTVVSQWLEWWLGYKYPQPPPFKPSKHPTLFIQYKSKEYTPKTQSKHSILSKSQNQVK